MPPSRTPDDGSGAALRLIPHLAWYAVNKALSPRRASFYAVVEVKLIIQIPCFNEAEQLPATLRDLPRAIAGVDTLEWLVVDDGSTDDTVGVARRLGVDHIVRLTNHKGLAAAFQAGLDACLKLGADVIVNTDADNQYRGADIPRLVEPILAGAADMVIGDRRVETIEHFSPVKKRLQRFGSAIVRRVSHTSVPDVTSGFRAYNREAALQVQVVSKFTYTLETIIQAGKMLVAVESVPVATNPKMRDSRLFPSTWAYVRRNGLAILRVYTMYEPLRVFAIAAGLAALAGAVIWVRFIYYFATGHGRGHVQSLILGATMLVIAVQLAALAVLADVLAAMRVLMQRSLERIQRLELRLGVEPSHYEAPDREAEAVVSAAGDARSSDG
jgi:glycosyltransferase involved in cell wall biosynthesis